MDITEKLSLAVQEIVNDVFGINEVCTLQATRKEFEGDFTFVFFNLVKSLKKSPVEIGKALGEAIMDKVDYLVSYNVIQGFLNLKLKDAVWIEVLNKMNTLSPTQSFVSKSEKVMVEYSSPNTNKPLHLGHLRNDFLGWSISNILDAAGYEVVKTCLVNDRGIHICKSMVAYQHFGNNETPQSSNMKGDHLVGKYYVAFDVTYKTQIADLIAQGKSEEFAKKYAPIFVEAQELLLKWEESDPATLELWNKMNGWVYEGFDETYKNIGVSFDKTYFESNTYLLGKELVDEALINNIFFKKPDGSVWIDLTEDGLDEKLVLRGDGTSVYITQDLGTTDLKFKDFGCDKSIWVVGNEQDYHFKVLFTIMKKLGRSYANGCYHLSYGMVDLPSGKMKSREGTVVDADELLSEMIATAEATTRERGKIDEFTEDEANKLFKMLALGALKYFLLKVEPKKRMLFNPEESIDFQGNTGPFIQYTHARIKSILRKGSFDFAKINPLSSNLSLNKEELELIVLLNDYKSIVEKAAVDYSPAIIANYVYELAKTFNTFYGAHSVLNDEVARELRLNLIFHVSETIKHGMNLLGIEVPERM